MPIIAFILLLIFTAAGTYTFRGDAIIENRPYGVISDITSYLIYTAYCVLCIANFIFCSIVIKFKENRAPNYILMLSNIAVCFLYAISNEYAIAALFVVIFLSPVFILGIIAWFITLADLYKPIENKFLTSLGYAFAIFLTIYITFIIMHVGYKFIAV